MAGRRINTEINAGSMADIAFLLLIFFLVTTTMDIDSGIMRVLPPMPEDEQIDEDQKIKDRNVFTVLVNYNDLLLVEGEVLNIKQLKKKAKEFIENKYDDIKLPEKKIVEIPYFGNYAVSKGVISLQNDRGTSYNMYIQVQNELTAAYNELRNELSMQKFGREYKELNSEQLKSVKKVFPMRISEAEPVEIGANI